jgi:hypothetical protein
MLAQLVVYLAMSMLLHHATRSFQFIDTSEEQARAEILLPSSVLKKLELESTESFCKSSIDKYKDKPKYLNDICLVQFVAKYNMKFLRNFVFRKL